MRFVIPILLVACGASHPHDVRVAGREVIAARAASAGELAAMMRDGVVNGGLLFADATCASQFGVPGKVEPAQVDAFAHCLAGLHLKASARQDEIADVSVLEYAPGIEVEARAIQHDGAWRLVWIGFASRRRGDPDAPTITDAALEALRENGERHATLDPAVVASFENEPQYTWLKVCLDAAGNVVTLDDYETTTTVAAKAFVDVATKWTFRAFTVNGAASPACAMLRMAYPTGSGGVEVLPLPPPPSSNKPRPVVLANSKFSEGKRIRGTREIIPDDSTRKAIKRRGIERIEGAFRICLDDAGTPESVLPLRSTGFPAYDERIIANMRAWRYSPYRIDDKPVSVCTKVYFIYSQRRGR